MIDKEDRNELTICVTSMRSDAYGLPLEINSAGKRLPREEQELVKRIVERALQDHGYIVHEIPVL